MTKCIHLKDIKDQLLVEKINFLKYMAGKKLKKLF